MKESILNHKKLLIVDDEPDILAILKRRYSAHAQTPKSTRQPTMKMPPNFSNPKSMTSLFSTSWVFVVLIFSKSL